MSFLHENESLSLWADTDPILDFLPLDRSIEVDVCVIGAGMAGITTAYLLAKEGKKVCVLESHHVGSGQTSKTTAHFTAVLDRRYSEIESLHGEAAAKLVVQSHTSAIELVRQIIVDEKIECDMQNVNGVLFGDGTYVDTIAKEYEACTRLGLKTKLDKNQFSNALLQGPALIFPNQLQLHPLKYLKALVAKTVKGGTQIFTGTKVTDIEEAAKINVKTEHGKTVTCSSLVVATNSPINDRFVMHTKQAPYRSYVVGFRLRQELTPGLYWDLSNPYHYVRVHKDILLVGGADHKTGQEEDPLRRYRDIEVWTRIRFPFADEIVYRWSGQVMEPQDGLAFIGHNPGNNRIYIVTGHSGNGMTYSTLGAWLICDQICERENPWEQIYAPNRINLKSVGTFVSENANVAAQYAKWLSLKGRPEMDDFPRGQGVVFRHGIKMVAAYKSNEGKWSYQSATCPHLGGVVTWNKAEKSWDCPCHGSRFDCHGHVIDGPAISDLQPYGA